MKLGFLAIAAGALIAPAISTQVSATVVVPPSSGNTITYTVETAHSVKDGLAFIQQGTSDKLYFAGQTLPAFPFPVSFSFDAEKAAKVDRTLLLGVSNFGNATHLVIGTNVPFALDAVGKDFASVFSGYNEATLINDLATLNAGAGAGYSAAYNDILGFGRDVESLGSDPAFKPPGAFDLLAFSNGSIIGSGSVQQSSAVPETSSWALMILGLGAVGGVLRRAYRKSENTAKVSSAVAF